MFILIHIKIQYFINQGECILCVQTFRICVGSLGPISTKGQNPALGSPTSRCSLRQYKYSHEPGTVTSLYRELDLDTLEKKRRKILRLTMFHKMLHGNVHICIAVCQVTLYPHYAQMAARISVSTSYNAYKYSLISRAIQQWNSLPVKLMSITDLQEFKQKVEQLV